MSSIKNPDQTMAMAETHHLFLGGIVSAYPVHGTWPGDINVDSDGDSVIDSNSTIINSNGLNDQYYNNLAPRHQGKTANLNFLDGHCEGGWTIPQIMALPADNHDLWGSQLF